MWSCIPLHTIHQYGLSIQVLQVTKLTLIGVHVEGAIIQRFYLKVLDKVNPLVARIGV